MVGHLVMIFNWRTIKNRIFYFEFVTLYANGELKCLLSLIFHPSVCLSLKQTVSTQAAIYTHILLSVSNMFYSLSLLLAKDQCKYNTLLYKLIQHRTITGHQTTIFRLIYCYIWFESSHNICSKGGGKFKVQLHIYSVRNLDKYLIVKVLNKCKQGI